MPITRKQKETILEKLQGIVKSVPSAVFVNFHGLTVRDVMEVRKELKANDVGYTVAKKTLIKKALESAKAKGDVPALDGEVAIAYPRSADAVDTTAPARNIYTFQKKFEGRMGILGGIFDGEFLNRERMLEIATIPSQTVLYGMFANVINSPIQRLVIALGAIAEKKN